MHVVVDARTVYRPHRRGTGKNLIDLYRRMATLRPSWRFSMLHRGMAVSPDPFAGLPNVGSRVVEMIGDRWGLWERVRLPMAAVSVGASVVHSPANTAPRIQPRPWVATVHDLIPLDSATVSTEVHAWERRVSCAVKRTRRVLTPSDYTKGRLVEHFGVPSERVVVNPWAPDSACVKVETPAVLADVQTRHGLEPGQPYVLAFGAVDPRKNTRRIIEAWAGLPAAMMSSLALLVVGLQEPLLSDLRRQLRARPIAGTWSLMPFAAEDDLPALLSGASALCYPSLSEGFGLPVLDAFACDTPVITSRTTSLPEVAGDAAILVDPVDTDAIRQAMVDVLAAGTAARLRAGGRQRLEHYSWDRCATTAADVLLEAART